MLTVTVDNRLRFPVSDIPEWAAESLREQFTHPNPEYGKLQALGYWAGKVPRFYQSWEIHGGEMTLPRGGTTRLRAVLDEAGVPYRFDVRVCDGQPYSFPAHSFPGGGSLAPFQTRCVDKLIVRQNCVVRSPTGSGKSSMGIASIARLGRTALIIVWTGALAKQWLERIEQELPGIPKRDIGMIGLGRKFALRPITVAMQQSLYSLFRKGGVEAQELISYFGVVVADELQRFAARTFIGSIDPFRARYRIGLSADECVAAGTMIAMADGSERAIEDVVDGDSVLTPLGPRIVRRSFYRGCVQTGVINGVGIHLRATRNTWVGSRVGWVCLESVCCAYLLNHEQRERLRSLRGTDAEALPGSNTHPLHPQAVRCERSVFDMWASGDAAESSFRPRANAQRGTLVERPDQRNPSVVGPNGDSCGAIEPREKSSLGSGVDASHSCQSGLPGQDNRNGSTAIRKRTASSVRWKEVGQWKTIASRRSPCFGNIERVRVQVGSRGGDGHHSSESLQARPRQCVSKDSSGDRRIQSQSEISACLGCQKRCPVGSVGVGGSQVLADVRSLEAAHRCHVSVEATVDFDGLYTNVYDLEIAGAGCYYANGILVHNTRKDGKEFLIYDEFGRVEVDIDRNDLVDMGFVLDVDVRVVPSDFRAEWYREERLPDGRENPNYRNFTMLLEQMCGDAERNALLGKVIELAARDGGTMVFSHRVEHCRSLNTECARSGIRSGLMLGGSWGKEFDQTKDELKSGKTRVGIGTYQAIGQAIDVPAVSQGVIATPVNNNRQMFGQVRGRMCRANRAGSTSATLYYVWDQNVFGTYTLKNLLAWNNRVSVLVGGQWVDARSYVAEQRRAASLFSDD